MTEPQLIPLTTYSDERGFFRKIARASDPFFTGFAQWSHSMKYEGYYTKQFHLHQYQTDYWYVPAGVIKAVVVWVGHPDNAVQRKIEGYQEYILDDEVLKIPPGWAHGLKVLEGPAHLLYVTDREYNPEDEGRIDLGYEW